MKTPTIRFSLCVFALLTLPSFSTATAETTERQPNFLVIITDDQRPDTVGALGNPLIHTPHPDRLARQGMVFTRATCAFPLCVPSRAEILTGATSFRNGAPFGGGRLRKDLVFWADAMRRGGYQTWYCGKWMNDGSPKTRGYEETNGLFSSGGAGAKGREPHYGRKDRLITGYRGWTFKKDDGTPELEKGIGLVGETSRYIAGPGIPQGKRTAAQIYLRDMDPTTCELAGIPIPESVESKSLVPILQGTASQIHPAIYGYYQEYQRMIRTDRWKLISYPHLNKYQLFDLKSDPTEQKDLSSQAEHSRVMASLTTSLNEWFRKQGDPLFASTLTELQDK